MDNNEQVVSTETKLTHGTGIPGFILGIVSLVFSWLGGVLGILTIPGLILSIVGLAKKNTKKGFSIAGLIINIISMIANVIMFFVILVPMIMTLFIGVGVMAPQMGKYIEKSQEAKSEYMKDTLKMAFEVSLMDPYVVESNDYYVIQSFMDGEYHYLYEIPDCTFRYNLEQILGESIDGSIYEDYRFICDQYEVYIE